MMLDLTCRWLELLDCPETVGKEKKTCPRIFLDRFAEVLAIGESRTGFRLMRMIVEGCRRAGLAVGRDVADAMIRSRSCGVQREGEEAPQVSRGRVFGCFVDGNVIMMSEGVYVLGQDTGQAKKLRMSKLATQHHRGWASDLDIICVGRI